MFPVQGVPDVEYNKSSDVEIEQFEIAYDKRCQQKALQ